jgi:hypothetical protein
VFDLRTVEPRADDALRTALVAALRSAAAGSAAAGGSTVAGGG